MDEQLWPQIKQIVADALELPAEERAQFVRKACDGNQQLLSRVQVYLARAEIDTKFLDEPVFSIHKKADGDDIESWSGRQVGPFLLKDLLGSGGMGAVYLGEHSAGDYDEDVAVKILHPKKAPSLFIRRLKHEGRVLKNLIHPYISRFLEGGATDNELPYIVMQRVDGVPIDQFCETKSLSVPQRIRLFQMVCEAVQYAHRKTVIHCDLKPENILVTPEGLPRLLDFGIAQHLGSSSPVTNPSILGRYLTPLYASPEQFRQEEPSTAVDVYALGLILYELLTNQQPHRLLNEGSGSLGEAACRVVPPLPSVAVFRAGEESSARRRSRLLAGDLDCIIMKALEKQPDERYLSVEDLSEDLQRYLDRLPVLARPQTLGYRASKFVRRRTGVVAAAVTLTAFAAWMAVQALEIDRQNTLLERQNVEITQERDRATDVREFLVEFLHSPDPSRSRGEVLTVKETLEDAARRLQSELRDEPEVRAELLDAIGRVFTNLALYAEAEPLLNDALETRRGALGSEHPLVAASLHNLAFLRRRQGRAEEAEVLRREAITIQRRAYPGGDPELAQGLNALASLLRERRALDESESLAREALAMQVQLLGDKDLNVAFTLNTLGSVSRLRGNLTQAAELYRQSLEIRQDHGGPVDPAVATALNSLALVLVELEDLPGALDMHREALAIREEVYPGDHPHRLSSLNNLAIALSLNDEHAEALARIREAIAMQERLKGNPRSGLTLHLNLVSIIERKGGDQETCLDAIEPVLSELEAHGRDYQVADAKSIRAGCLARSGLFDEAEPILLASHEQLLEHLGKHARQTRQARGRIIQLYEASGRPELAKPYRFSEAD